MHDDDDNGNERGTNGRRSAGARYLADAAVGLATAAELLAEASRLHDSITGDALQLLRARLAVQLTAVLAAVATTRTAMTVDDEEENTP